MTFRDQGVFEPTIEAAAAAKALCCGEAPPTMWEQICRQVTSNPV